MQILENIKPAFEGLMANKMRSLLTMLGIIIGIAAVIAVVTVGNAMTAAITSEMYSLGANNIQVLVQPRAGADITAGFSGSAVTTTDSDLITIGMIEKLNEQFQDKIAAIALSVEAGVGHSQERNLVSHITVKGVNPEYGFVNNINLLSGRFISEQDVFSRSNAVVVSDRFAEEIFPLGEEALGREIRIILANHVKFYMVVGIYEHNDAIPAVLNQAVNFGNTVSRTDVYIPLATANALRGGGPAGFHNFVVMAERDVDLFEFEAEIRGFLNTFYADNPRFWIATLNMDRVLSITETIMGVMSIAVAVIAGISLVVGGVGVMNIMLFAVTERTREIGIRKALGARSSSIRLQFITEAVIICAIGGILGIGFGVALGYTGSWILGFPGWPTIDIVLIAVLFSMAVGLFFGYYPANKAAKLDPINALRYE
jgi:putative ABC transport system permease protein